VIFISLAPADRSRFAALSERLVGQPRPRDQLAIVVGGQVVAHPVVTGVRPADTASLRHHLRRPGGDSDPGSAGRLMSLYGIPPRLARGRAGNG
jgi:hypothetical protein